MKYKLIFVAILLIGFFLRFYQLDSIPSGIYFDEASQGYNAYSILKTGKDEYGKSYPLLLRSFGYYASSLYAYFSIIPISLLGLTIFATRFLSALSGSLLIFLTYKIVNKLEIKDGKAISLLAAFLVTISPWSILFSRGAFEANFALTIFVISIYLFILSLKNKKWLPLAAIILGVSTYAYQSERLVAPLFLLFFLIINRKILNGDKKIVAISLIGFFLILIPQLSIIATSGSSIRFNQLSYIGSFLDKKYFAIPILNNVFIGFNIFKEFLSQYIAYFSPRNIFFDPDPQLIRSIPNLSVFYPWMVIPFLFGFKHFILNKENRKLFLILLIISPIPASITTDPYSVLRVLPLLWVFAIVIALGFYQILIKISKKSLRVCLLAFIVLLSCLHLYTSYFVLLKHERSKEWGYGYKELFHRLKGINRQIIMEDNSGPAYIEYAFYNEYDPQKMQLSTDPKLVPDYYNLVAFDKNIKLGNIEFRPIDYSEIENKDQVVVVDPKAFSYEDAKSHRLEQLFEIKDKREGVLFTIYQTHPKKI
jgi:hypothetical protein